MDPDFTQTDDIFADANPGITYDADNQTGTIDPGVLVSSSQKDGILSNKNGSTLINQGSILSGSILTSLGYAVEFNGDNASVINSVGARILGVNDGVHFDGPTTRLENHGSIVGFIGDGVEFDEDTTDVTLLNGGSISGRLSGVLQFSDNTGGVIRNAGSITSDRSGIDVDTRNGLTTVIANAAGAIIRGGDHGIFVELGAIHFDNRGTVIGGIRSEVDNQDVIANHGRIQGGIELAGGNDVFLGTGGGSTEVEGGSGSDMIVGGGKADSFFGGDDNDRLSGAAGNDRLEGGSGFDTLTGGAGRDHFIFGGDFDAKSNVDRVTDFTANVDKIELDREGLGPNGVLAAAEFHVGATATDRSDRIVYNPNTGFLFFDADGKGGVAQIHFATLTPHLALHNTDFLVDLIT